MKPAAYQVDMRAVVQHRAGDFPAPGTLTLALLTGPPAPEGGNVHRITAQDYADQALAILSPPKGSRTLVNKDPILFSGVLNWAQASHVGLLNEGGQLIAYGPLVSSPGSAGADEVMFAATSIRIK